MWTTNPQTCIIKAWGCSATWRQDKVAFRPFLGTKRLRRNVVGVVQANDPFGILIDVPKTVFDRPESIFAPPQKLFPTLTQRDVVLAKDEALQDFPWETAIIFVVGILVVWEIFIRISGVRDGGKEDKEGGEGMIVTQSIEDQENAIKEFNAQDINEENNRGLVWLSIVTAIALWMSGFLTSGSLTPSP
ncbi:hypothetical protein BSKO_06654 [Bryopsis sp. KO-2023]|nr:hypothetical protein BSKO_06654 [Bryopsis sp. KO-2023]